VSAAAPRVSVVVPARDAAATVGRTIAAVLAQEVEGGFELIVVDDGSRDETASVAERAAGPVTLLRLERCGAAEARNRGAAAARGEALAFTDADCVPAPGWLAAGCDALRQADLVQGRVEPDPEASLGPFDRSLWIGDESGLFETANLFVTRAIFERAGGFEEWVDTGGTKLIAEDVWFGWRAIRAGARARFEPSALVHHAVFPRSVRDYALERLRLRYFPAIARRVPELRPRFFLHVFLTPRSAAFDAALAGAAAAALRGSRGPLVAVAPYAWMSAREALRWGARRSPKVAAGRALADLVGFGALTAGSLRARTPLL
jgi:glycosyltransferase involved in cell wall biosynthesis